MLYFIKTLVNLILPPGCLIILLFIYIIIYYKKNKNLPKLIVYVAAVFYIISIPLTSDFLIHSLEYNYQPVDKLTGDVIVVLGGGATLDSPDFSGSGNLSGAAANRLLTATRVHNKTGIPIIFSGGQVFKTSGNEAEIAKSQLLDLGLSESSIIIENKSLNTTENAKFTAALLKKGNYTKPILVTSAFHMPRAAMNCKNAGIKNLEIYPCDYSTNKNLSISFNAFIPNGTSLYNSFSALHEYLGMLKLLIKK